MNEFSFNWTRINNDVNGNPRYVVHYCEVCPESISKGDIMTRYEQTVKLMNKAGGRKFHNKQYGGGIVFQSYNLASTEQFIKETIKKYEEANKCD